MPEVIETLRTALRDRYSIERELGRGAAGIVYLARELKHDRQVALKILNPELALAVRTERFLREIQIAARLSHPHILTLIDSGQAGDSLYYVMPYVEGESLRDRLNREKQLPIDDAIAITKDVAAALEYAHGQGIVHRDIKPENILLSHGKPVVMDFGIARALTVAGGESVTHEGVAVGTPAYMAPEQAAGKEIDGRSDLYSLGCVLYEMLAGHPPYQGNTAQEILSRHVLDPIPTVRAAREAVPESLEQVIRRTLAKQPADRFASATQLMAALAGPAGWPRSRARTTTLGLGAAAVVAVVAAAGMLPWRRILPLHAADLSLAVLPCLNLSADTTTDYFADGMTEDLINKLSQIGGLKVPGFISSLRFKGRSDVRQAADSLGVAHVLECTVRGVGPQLRIAVRLVRPRDGVALFAETYPREIKDVFAVQAELAREIAGALQVRLAGSQVEALAWQPTQDQKAYDSYLQGRSYLRRGTEAGLRQALEHFRGAVVLDSTFALAHAGLADTYRFLLQLRFMPQQEALPLMKLAASRALELDSGLAEAYIAMGRVAIADWDWDRAEHAFERAIALNAKSPEAHDGYANLVSRHRGRRQDGLRESLEALRLDPLSPVLAAAAARHYQRVGDYDQAVLKAQFALGLEPNSINARQYLGEIYFDKGMTAQAIEVFQRLLDQLGGRGRAVPVLARLGYAYAKSGDQVRARNVLAQMQKHAKDPGYALSLSLLYVGLGDTEAAWKALGDAEKEHDFSLPNTVPQLRYWDPLRSDPRYGELLKRLKLDL